MVQELWLPAELGEFQVVDFRLSLPSLEPCFMLDIEPLEIMSSVGGFLFKDFMVQAFGFMYCVHVHIRIGAGGLSISWQATWQFSENERCLLAVFRRTLSFLGASALKTQHSLGLGCRHSIWNKGSGVQALRTCHAEL